MIKLRALYRSWRAVVPTLASLLIIQSCSTQPELKPPSAMRHSKIHRIHGHQRTDDYYWLRHRDSADVIAYLKKENAYTDKAMAHTEQLQETLNAEMIGRIQETDSTVPAKSDDYYYYQRTEKGKQYDIYCRKRGSLDAPEEIILDVNQLALGFDFCDIGSFSPSPNHRLLAYSVDTSGSEEYHIQVKDLDSGELLPDSIPGTYGKVVWANDNRTLFYTTLDETLRPAWAYRHRLGDNTADDKLMLEEPDKAYEIELWKTGTKQYIVAQLASNETSEVRILPASQPNAEFTTFEPRKQSIEYEIDHHEHGFFILTNEDAPNFRVMTAPESSPSRSNWKELIPHREAVKIDYVEMFEDYYVLFERENGLKQVAVYDIETNTRRVLEMPEPIYAVYPTFETEYESDILRYKYTSLTTPNTIVDYNMGTRETTIMKRDSILGGFDPSNYVSERLFAAAEDGTRIPISIVHRKDLPDSKKSPLYLYGYGAYGYTTEPRFSSYRLSLLDRGFVFAIAHVRGGGTMGRYWYDQGKLMNKMNTFSDFIACAEHLIAKGYTSPSRLVISGGSAGGLLVGAVINMRPDLFKAAIADVPFVDVINTMLDPSIPLTVTEYEEWGNPNNEQFYKYMLQYSPYDNVTEQDYPALLVLAGLNDPRVQYWEPAKWVAKLRASKTDNNLLLLRTYMEAGHMGSSGRYDYIREIAFEYAFLLDQFKIAE